MTARVSITESNAMQALGEFLTSIIDAEIVSGLDNLVPSPMGDFAVMTPIMQKRLAMNTMTTYDCAFYGSVDELVLTVDEMIMGEIVVGSQVFGPHILAGTFIESKDGETYLLNKSQTVDPEKMATGNRQDLVPKEVTVQVDIYGPESSENAMIIEGLFRSGWGFDNFQDSGFDIRPLYCSDPRQNPFTNAEQQTDKRWMIDCTMQINPVITVPQQFADALDVELIEVDTTYPA